MNKELEWLKQDYQNIEIPDELSAVIQQAIERGKEERKRQNESQNLSQSQSQSQSQNQSQRVLSRNRWAKRIGISAAAVFILFSIGVNTMPALASSLENIPGLGKLVKVLQFNKGGAEGGQLSESTDVHAIGLHEQGDSDQITIRFQQNNKEQEIASSFHAQYREYPNTMTFSVHGARNFSAEQDLATLKKSRYVADAYTIMSLDDSLIRFTIVFKEPVAYEVKEYKNPAEVVLTLKPATGAEESATVYAIRTASYPYGEKQGMMEEIWIEEENVRILKDRAGTYLVEAGYYSTKEEAQSLMRKLEEQYGLQGQLYIEERNASQLPEAIVLP